MPVGQNLKLDVMRPLDILFEKDAAVAKRRLSFPGSHFHVLAQFTVRPDDAKSSTTASGARFNDDRVADLVRKGQGLLGRADSTLGTGHDRDADRFGKFTC